MGVFLCKALSTQRLARMLEMLTALAALGMRLLSLADGHAHFLRVVFSRSDELFYLFNFLFVCLTSDY